jgi:DNA ligase-1
MIVDGVVTSRSGKPIPNRYVQSKYGIQQLNGYDGELVVGSPVDKNCMQRTTSGVMSFDGEPSVSFWVFDRWDIANEPYFERLGAITGIPELQVYRLNHEPIHSYEALQKYEALQTSGGYEGVMVRGYNNKYKFGRSTLLEGGLIKVKRFYDSEAIIVGYEPLYRNENAPTKNELGYTERSTHQANKFADDLLGSGFDMAQRERLWKDPNKLIGRIVKYKSFSVGVVDKPRFPIFLGFRDPLDM